MAQRFLEFIMPDVLFVKDFAKDNCVGEAVLLLKSKNLEICGHKHCYLRLLGFNRNHVFIVGGADNGVVLLIVAQV
jgi:hypothetical protein